LALRSCLVEAVNKAVCRSGFERRIRLPRLCCPFLSTFDGIKVHLLDTCLPCPCPSIQMEILEEPRLLQPTWRLAHGCSTLDFLTCTFTTQLFTPPWKLHESLGGLAFLALLQGLILHFSRQPAQPMVVALVRVPARDWRSPTRALSRLGSSVSFFSCERFEAPNDWTGRGTQLTIESTPRLVPTGTQSLQD
jgi:hypothetical protein